MWLILFAVLAASRAIVPLLLFSEPVLATLASLLADASDGYAAFRARLPWKNYHRYDKLADWWWYFWILLYGLRLPIGQTLLFLFLFRSIGQALTIITSNERLLLAFPNVLELYFVAFLFTWPFPGFMHFFKTGHELPLLLLLTAAALIREYVLHIKKHYAANYLFGLNLDWRKNERGRKEFRV